LNPPSKTKHGHWACSVIDVLRASVLSPLEEAKRMPFLSGGEWGWATLGERNRNEQDSDGITARNN
jgi:hypothetical protein